MDEFEVRFGEIVGGEIGGFDPSELGYFDGAGLAGRDCAFEEVQFNGFRRIVMRRRVRLVENVDVNPEFLQQLALQRGGEGFSCFHFSPGEFPKVWKMRIREPACEEDMPVAADDGCGDGDHKD